MEQAITTLTDDLNEQKASPLADLGLKLREEFDEAVQLRRPFEQQWIKDLRQYKGIYDPDIEAKIPKNRSRANIRLTRAKVKSTDARMMDMLFPAGDKNWTIRATPVPELDPALLANEIEMIKQRDGEVDEDAMLKAINKMAEERAVKMSSEIEDQLGENEGNYPAVSRDILHSGHLFGTGILKGPMVERRTKAYWTSVQKGPKASQYVMDQRIELKPFFKACSIWNIYPDPYATELEECDYIWERHVLSKHELRKLAKRKGFDAAQINIYIHAYPSGDITQLTQHEMDLRGIKKDESRLSLAKKYEVVERWGMIDGQYLRDAGVGIGDDQLDTEFEAQAWIVGNRVIRLTLNPTEQQSRPYKFYYFEKDETSIWGNSIPSVLRDPAMLFNAAIRMLVDNAAMSAGGIFEVNADLLEGDEDPSEIGPFRVYIRSKGDAMAPAVRVHQIPNNTQQLMSMANLFMELGDESTTIPRFTYGQQGKGVTDTVGGLSMLLGQANVTIKDNVKNWDDGITTPFIGDCYHWNMQFSERDDIKGDFETIARGMSSLVAKEIRSKALDNFASTTANQLDAPLIKRSALNRERAKALDLPADDLVKTEEEIELENAEAQMLKDLQEVIAIHAQQAGVTPDEFINTAMMARQNGLPSPMQSQGAANV